MSSEQGPGLLRKPVKIACIQFASTPDKTLNLQEAQRLVTEAASNGARLIVLPECFNSPYSTTSFPEYAEVLQPAPPPETSPSFHALSRMAKDAGVYLIGGSIPERESETRNIYNTTLAFSPAGELLGFHRKAHLFDVDFPGKMTFRESDTLSPGDAITTVELPDYGTIGLGICYDIRFAEYAAVAARKGGAFALIFPSAFNSTTGPLHWELVARSRALDNQVYVAMCSQSYKPGAGYPAWGHSMVVDPNGQIMETTERDDAIVYAQLDDASIGQARRQVPIGFQRRFDLYPDISKVAVWS